MFGSLGSGTANPVSPPPTACQSPSRIPPGDRLLLGPRAVPRSCMVPMTWYGTAVSLLDGAMATPILPHGPSGRPCSPGLSCVHVSPPSRDVYRPLPGPPEVISHGLRRVCHRPANRMRGLFGSRHTSLAPVSASLLS